MAYREPPLDRPYALRVKGEGAPFAHVDAATLEKLRAQLTREHPGDRSYWLDAATLQWLGEAGLDPELVAELAERIARRPPDEGGVEIEWLRAGPVPAAAPGSEKD